MQQSEACAGPMHLTGQAQALNLPPRPQQPNQCRRHVADVRQRAARGDRSAEMNMLILRAGGQIEWLSMLTVMHGLREARQSMLCARA